MKHYAVYCIARGVRLVGAEWIQAEGDDHALATAARLSRGIKREVWLGGRLVGKIEVDPEADNSD